MNNIIKLNSFEFIEKYINIKRSDYQKLPVVYYLPSRGCNKRLTRFLQIYNNLIRMKDNNMIVIIKSDGNVKMSKKEFVSWLSRNF